MGKGLISATFAIAGLLATTRMAAAQSLGEQAGNLDLNSLLGGYAWLAFPVLLFLAVLLPMLKR
jgi:hypothetical protein